MPEEVTTTPTGETPQAGASTDAPLPQAGKTTPPEPQAGDGQQEPMSLEEAKKLRSEHQSLRKREKELITQLKAYQDAEQAKRDAELSEVELIKKQHAETERLHQATLAELKQERVYNAVMRHAAKLNFILSPERLVHLLSESEIEYEDGRPTNIEKLLSHLAKAEPELVRKTEPPPQSQAETPAQPAQPNVVRPPATPPNNPGRSQIAAPNSNPPGTRMTLQEYYARQRQQS